MTETVTKRSYGRGLRSHLHLLRVLGVLLGILLLIGWGLFSLERSSAGQGLDSSKWQWASASSFQEAAPPEHGWIPLTSRPDLHNESRYYWLRIPLADDGEELSLREPTLWVFNAPSLRVFDRGQSLFAYDPNERNDKINLFTHWNASPLPAPLPPELYVLIDNREALNPAPWIGLIDKSDLLVHLVRKDTYSFVLAGFFLFGACVALGLYWGRRDRLHLYFFLLSLCCCYAAFVRNFLLQAYWDQPWLSYLELAVFPFGVTAFVSSIHEVFRMTLKTRVLDEFRRILFWFSCLTFASALFLNMKWYSWLLSYPLLALFFLTAGIVFWVLRSTYRERKDPESIWMLAGFLIVTSLALIHVLRIYLPAVFGRMEHLAPPLAALPFDLLSVAMFLFLLCLVRVIIYRFGLLNEKLLQFNKALEEKVAERTSELQGKTTQLKEANARLSRSMREKAETLADSKVLEERNRITGTIHDTIGHSLTATIVQLEAAKRLLERDPLLAEDKLGASQELVRRGLEQIQQSVPMLREDSGQYDLAEAMNRLIRETESSTGASVERAIGTLPASLLFLHKRVLFQALQEGLTNGLRHGASRRFEFSLRAENGQVLFRLASDGNTYKPAAFGFGLRAMSERVSQLGGLMTVSPGQPGCILAVSLPYEASGQQGLATGGLK